MKLTPVWPVAGPAIDAKAPYARDTVAQWYGRLDGERTVRVNLVTTVDGSALGPDGTSGSLTGGADRIVLGALRRLADVVLVGSATLRAEPGLLPRSAPLAVLTQSGDLGGVSVAPNRVHGPVLVLGPDRVRDAVAASTTVPHEFIGLGAASALDTAIPSALEALAARGLRHVVCEGGPSLVTELLRLQLVTELCLTTAPVVGSAASAHVLPAMNAQNAELLSVLVDEAGYLYTRRRVR